MDFNAFFKNVNVPVIVFIEGTDMTVVYENRSAIVRFNPLMKDQSYSGPSKVTELIKIPKDDFRKLMTAFSARGEVTAFSTTVDIYTGETVPVSVAANRVVIDGVSYVQMFIYQIRGEDESLAYAEALSEALILAYESTSPDEAISNILSFAGNFTGVSRSYIFESISDTLTSNTYEWCAEGVKPEIENLQVLPKADYNYDQIIENGLAVTDDIRLMSPEDQAILAPQGIKALAIVPILFRGTPLGYVGYDDCKKYRKWSPEEVTFLKRLSDLLATVLFRRDTENSIRYSMEILNTVTDNTNHFVIASDIHSHKLLFINSSFAKAVGTTVDKLKGKLTCSVIEKWASNADDYCSLEHMVDKQGKIICNEHTWEFKNETDQKWYLIKSSIIKWIDGRNVNLETMTEITGQKLYEAQLMEVATSDPMTGIRNREWGRQLISHIMLDNSSYQDNSLAFLDLDDLKTVNDKYGHAAGDRMITKTIDFLKSRIRRSDSLIRWGGDEFILVARADISHTEKIIESVIAAIEQYNKEGHEPFRLGFSYGIVNISTDGTQTVDSLISQADALMYANKIASRNRRK